MIFKCFSEKINPNVPGIITLSHGPLALAILESASYIAGSVENTIGITLETTDDPDEYRNKVVEALAMFPAGAIILIDMFGGTPCNQTARVIEDSTKPVYAMAGMNLSAVLTCLSERDEMSPKELLKAVREAALETFCDLTEFVDEE